MRRGASVKDVRRHMAANNAPPDSSHIAVRLSASPGRLAVLKKVLDLDNCVARSENLCLLAAIERHLRMGSFLAVITGLAA